MTTQEQALEALDVLRAFVKGASPTTPTTPPKPVDPRIAIINERLNGQAAPIMRAAAVTGLPLADACALVEIESAGGQNIFGHDWGPTGDAPPFYGHPVTAPRVDSLIAQPGYKSGDAKMNGVGLTQLTFYTYVLEADALQGGASVPLNQCRVGFKLLNTYLHKYPRQQAIASYNAGESGWRNGIVYAQKFEAEAKAWRARLIVPDKPDGNEKLLAHGVKDGTNFAKGHKVLMQLLDRMPYEIWYSGNVPDGPMAWAANRPLPPVPQMLDKTCACMGVGNIYRRAAGKIVPTRGNSNFDGGVAAYFYSPASFPGVGVLGPGFFSQFDVPFELETAKKWARDTKTGVLIGRSYANATLGGQGHVAILLPDGKVMQSYLFGAGGQPGLNDKRTIEESNAGGYYTWMVHPKDWIEHDKNQFREVR